MSVAIVLIVSPSLDSDSRPACSGRGQLFDGLVDGRLIVTRSSQPLLDGARVLLAEGVDPTTRIAMRHACRDCDALRSTVGAAAGLTVRQDNGPPQFAPYRAPDFRTGPLPMRSIDPAAPTPPPKKEGEAATSPVPPLSATAK